MWKSYLKDFDKFTAQRTEIANSARDSALRTATAQNLLSTMRLRGIKINHRPSEVDLFTFVIAFEQLMVHSIFNVPVPSKGK